MLRVQKTKTTLKSTEAAFEKKFAAALTRAGLFSWHTAEKFISGIPDRYVVGGNWIEFKAIPYVGTRRITPQRFFKPAQKIWLDDLHEAGDRTFACVLFQPENGDPKVLLCPWIELRDKGSMTPSEISQVTYICKNNMAMDHLVGLRFSKKRDNYSNYAMYMRA